MAAVVNLGEFEQMILLAVLRLRDNAYGVTIRAEPERCTPQSSDSKSKA
jgi:PadR family transcriptional regulator PadR